MKRCTIFNQYIIICAREEYGFFERTNKEFLIKISNNFWKITAVRFFQLYYKLIFNKKLIAN